MFMRQTWSNDVLTPRVSCDFPRSQNVLELSLFSSCYVRAKLFRFEGSRLVFILLSGAAM